MFNFPDSSAWIDISGKLIPLGFEYKDAYKDASMDHPYKNKKTDTKFIDNDGNRKIVSLESTIHKIMEWFQVTNSVIKFTTMYDYIKYLGFDPKKNITDEVCEQKTSYNCLQLFNGKIWKYWPRINDINELSSGILQDFIDERYLSGLSPATLNKDIGTLKRIYQYFNLKGFINHTPATNIKRFKTTFIGKKF